MMKAAALMFVAMSLIPAADASGKLLTAGGVSPLFVAWTRFMLGAAMVVPIFWISTFGILRDWRIWLRGGLFGLGITSIQFAASSAPLADVFAAFFVGPIISYVLAGVFLGEPVSWRRSLLLALGFAGVLLVVRPGLDMSPGLAFAVLAGTCYGTFLTVSRWVTPQFSTQDLLVTQLVLGAILLTPFGWPNWPSLDTAQLGLTFLSALFSMLGNLLLLVAYRMAPATVLAPTVYFQLFAAVLLGWSIFNDLPDLQSWIGMAVILVAGVLAARIK